MGEGIFTFILLRKSNKITPIKNKYKKGFPTHKEKKL